MNKKQFIPNIRFHGFTDGWAQRRLGDEVDFFSGLTYSPDNIVKEGGTFVLRSSNVQNGEIVEADNVYVEHEAVNSTNVQVGDIVIVVRNGSRSLIGKHAAIKKPMEKTVIGAFMTGIHSETSSFINALLDTRQFEIEIHKNLGATINQITTGNFKKMEFNFPTKFEQEKTGSFFKELDDTITLQQQLLDDYKQLKKAMLQKMFPQKGESVPRVRFAGYTSEWEIEPLSRLGKIMTGSTPLTLNKDNYSNEGILWITPTDIKGRIVTNTSRKISKMGETGARIAPAGTILVTSIASIGKNTLLLTRAGFNQQINSLTPNKNNDSYFLFTQSKIWSEKMKRVASSGIMQIVNKTEFSSIKTSIPQLEEQIKIGKIFKKLDETIELHEQKLETYQKLKKAMLQKMFV